MATIGIIGLGLLGSALAERLLSQGRAVLGFDLEAARNAHLVELGGVATDSALKVAAAAQVIFLSLPTSDVAGCVLDELAPQLSGKTVLDTTTGDPDAMAACGERLAQIGCDYLDATIAGSSTQVRQGEVLVMLGGAAACVACCESLLAAFSSRHFHLGSWGAGARMKLVVNLVLGLNRAVLAEGLAFAQASGVEPHKALEVLQASPAYSRVMDTKGERMLTGNFTPEARLAQHAKDVGLILQQADANGTRLPLSTLHRQLLEELIAGGWGEMDNSAIVRAFAKSLDLSPKG